MTDIQGRVRAALRAQLRTAGATDLEDERLFDEVDRLFRRALANDDSRTLLLPALLTDDWRPELSLRLTSHRGGVGRVIVFFKRRVLLPLTRWLFEYTLENFRRQQRTNLVLMACLQTMAIEHARLRQELAEWTGTGAASDTLAADADPSDTRGRRGIRLDGPPTT